MEKKYFKQIKRGKKVVNETELDFSSGYKLNVADIIDETLHALQWKVLVPHERLEVTVENGKLTLTGEVEHTYRKDSRRFIWQRFYYHRYKG